MKILDMIISAAGIPDASQACRTIIKLAIEAKKYCPCGGIILADYEDCTTPLCIECGIDILNVEKKYARLNYGEK